MDRHLPPLTCFSYSCVILSFQPLIGGGIVAVVVLLWGPHRSSPHKARDYSKAKCSAANAL
jgi:hypothetical protein